MNRSAVGTKIGMGSRAAARAFGATKITVEQDQPIQVSLYQPSGAESFPDFAADEAVQFSE